MPRVGWRNETAFHNANSTLWTEPLWFLISSIIAAFPHQISRCSPSSHSLSSSVLISLCFLKAELCFSSQGQGPIICHSYFRDKSSAAPWSLFSCCRGLCFLLCHNHFPVSTVKCDVTAVWPTSQVAARLKSGFIGDFFFWGGGVFWGCFILNNVNIKLGGLGFGNTPYWYFTLAERKSSVRV